MNEYKLPKIFNWQTASDKLVKKYVADLYQTGTNAPVATELFNNTDVAFTYEYFGLGTYGVTSSQPVFSSCGMGCPSGQKNQVTVSNQLAFFGGPVGAVAAFPVSDNLIIILTDDGSGAADDVLGNFLQNTLEITFYPNH
jgi:hypothetical protein